VRLLGSGDKRGNIGIFTPDWHQDDACVTVLKAHNSSVTWLAFDAGRPHSLYMSSYENIVRRLDVERQVFDEVLALEPDEHDFLATCHLHTASGVLRCGFGTGHLLVKDPRGARASTQQLHDKTIRSIDMASGGANEHLMITASIDRTAKLWDIRKLRRTDFLASVEHGQGVTQARFGRGVGGVAITTSYDDSCKVLDVASGKVTSTIRRNNCTGLCPSLHAVCVTRCIFTHDHVPHVAAALMWAAERPRPMHELACLQLAWPTGPERILP
jgi:WD40 repeat protein